MFGLAGVLTALYLFVELAFNARLLDVAGGLPTIEDLKRLEWQGGLVSAAGATLIVWRIVLHVQVRRQPGEIALESRLRALIITALIVGPLVFLGQRYLIDWLVDRASAPERERAVMSLLLSEVVQREVAEIQGLALDSATMRSPEGKTLLAILPFLAYSSATMTDTVRSRLDVLMSGLVRQRAGDPDRLYDEHYITAVNGVRQRFNTDYREASVRIADAELEQGSADEAWREYQLAMSQQPFTADSATPAQRAAVIRKLRERGVPVPDGWRLDDRAGFMAALPAGQARTAFRRRADQILGGRTTIPPGLGWREFSRHPDVRRFLASELRARSDILASIDADRLSLEFSRAGFRAQLYEPQVRSQARERVAQLRKAPRTYLPGGSNADEASRAVRAVIVPPLALSLSLFFGLLNMAMLISSVLIGATAWRLLVSLAVLVAAVAVPLSLENQITRSDAYRSLESTIEREHGMGAKALAWVVRAEPLFYPFARAIGVMAPFR